jgi:predicted RNase H-like nuclease (RuvC/YqgF family)
VIILGVDPGANTGMAIYQDGELKKLTTIEPVEMAYAIKLAAPDRVVFEDSRLTSFMFTTVKSRAVALSMARKVGQVDAWSGLIAAICERLYIPCNGISPRQKGAKLNAEQFEKATGWVGKSNQHERDAAMTAWSYRMARK